jgi:hypothetical protein
MNSRDQINKLGMGVMISMLGGNEDSVKSLTAGLNKTISELTLTDEELTLLFRDNTKLTFFDNGQSCCEHRYMRSDDKLSDFIGATFTGAQLKEADPKACEYGEHEIQFLEIQTSNGPLTISNHNEHNGYYGGFSIRCK